MGGKTETKTESVQTQSVRVEEFPYEETLRIYQGQSTSDKLADTTEAAARQESGRESDSFKDSTGKPVLYFKDWKTTTNVVDSGFQYEGDWLAVKWDKARYAVGIRELNLYSNTYEVVSEMVSVPYRTPGPISKIALHADMIIPREFTDVDPLRSWIEFYISVDNGRSWNAIGPVSSRPVSDNQGKKLPVIYNINSPLPEEERLGTQGYIDTDTPPKEVRVRIRLLRPEGEAYKMFTPVLRGYKAKLSIERPII